MFFSYKAMFLFSLRNAIVVMKYNHLANPVFVGLEDKLHQVHLASKSLCLHVSKQPGPLILQVWTNFYDSRGSSFNIGETVNTYCGYV